MSANSSIEWTDRTWNPVRGCSVISPGCHNCYAMKQAHRFSGPGRAYAGLTKLTERSGPQWTGAIALINEALTEPLTWRKPARVFVNSMADLFHEDVPFDFVDRVFGVMALCPQHTFQILTKRADRMRVYMDQITGDGEWESRIQSGMGQLLDGKWIFNAGKHLRGRIERGMAAAMGLDVDDDGNEEFVDQFDWPLKNVWLGVSVESQKYADERIPHLLNTPAAVRFISAEPLLGPVDLGRYMPSSDGFVYRGEQRGPVHINDDNAQLNWVIVGGESGNGARPFGIHWARSIVDQCRDAKVPVFVKQLGAHPYRPRTRDDGKVTHAWDEQLALNDRKGGDMSEWSADLRVRQFPEVSP